MKTKSIDLNVLAIEARDGLATGAQDKFAQLYEELNGRKQAYVASSISKYPSLQSDDLNALFDDLLLEELRKYDDTETDFLQRLNQALTFRTLSILPKAIMRGITYAPRGKVKVASLEAAVEEKGDGYVPQTVPSAEEANWSLEFDSWEAELEWVNRQLDVRGIEDIAVRAGIIRRYEEAAKPREEAESLGMHRIADISGDRFRNGQQYWRKLKNAVTTA